MTVIGITGPTGSGKTTALTALERLGFQVVDCDALYYRMLDRDQTLREGIRKAFGPVFLPDGKLDRPAPVSYTHLPIPSPWGRPSAFWPRQTAASALPCWGT